MTPKPERGCVAFVSFCRRGCSRATSLALSHSASVEMATLQVLEVSASVERATVQVLKWPQSKRWKRDSDSVERASWPAGGATEMAVAEVGNALVAVRLNACDFGRWPSMGPRLQHLDAIYKVSDVVTEEVDGRPLLCQQCAPVKTCVSSVHQSRRV
jgi:hypothetical protein